MGPVLQTINNLFMVSLLYIIVALIGFGLSWMIRVVEDNPITPIIDKWASRIRISFSLGVIVICFCILTITSYVVSDVVFRIVGAIFFITPIVIAGLMGFLWESRRNSKRLKQ